MLKATSTVAIISHALVVCLLFWVLSTAGHNFYYRELNLHKREAFECGFESTNTFETQLKSKFTIVILLVLTYDVELLFLLPNTLGFFNNYQTSIQLTITTILILTWTCSIDLLTRALTYQN